MAEQRQTGFTLVELMITTLIVAVLATLAMPSYTAQRLRVNRSEAYAALDAIMQAEERFAVENGGYTLDLSTLGYGGPRLTPSGYYAIRAESCGTTPINQCVLLIAAARGNQVNDHNNFRGNLSLDSRGARKGW